MVTTQITERTEAYESESYSSEPLEVSDSRTNSWLHRISETVYANPAVEALFVSKGEEAVRDYWVVIPERDIALVRELISDQQEKVLFLFAETENVPFQLDFHIVYRNGRDIKELIPSTAISVTKP
ncbi:MAG: hypothetical protein IH861_09125 [Chloroflexi bacterium]|nr:hypothetical protein [Chloroflexota bacterium]